jgi:hypothetical protein
LIRPRGSEHVAPQSCLAKLIIQTTASGGGDVFRLQPSHSALEDQLGFRVRTRRTQFSSLTSTYFVHIWRFALEVRLRTTKNTAPQTRTRSSLILTRSPILDRHRNYQFFLIFLSKRLRASKCGSVRNVAIVIATIGGRLDAEDQLKLNITTS